MHNTFSGSEQGFRDFIAQNMNDSSRGMIVSPYFHSLTLFYWNKTDMNSIDMHEDFFRGLCHALAKKPDVALKVLESLRSLFDLLPASPPCIEVHKPYFKINRHDIVCTPEEEHEYTLSLFKKENRGLIIDHRTKTTIIASPWNTDWINLNKSWEGAFLEIACFLIAQNLLSWEQMGITFNQVIYENPTSLLDTFKGDLSPHLH